MTTRDALMLVAASEEMAHLYRVWRADRRCVRDSYKAARRINLTPRQTTIFAQGVALAETHSRVELVMHLGAAIDIHTSKRARAALRHLASLVACEVLHD
jgi:hypothetical protein